ncbi:MAG: hypothetical protein EA425_12275 [Puniceicoccaceae bacterium]|nr:MAG: hypothetical protein EA425_12275 [Puniceicoccaceae bacterium]
MPKRRPDPPTEANLYGPVKALLVRQGFTVKGEVGDCDVVAVRGKDPPVLVELKTTVNLRLLVQAVERQRLSPLVYLGIPAEAASFRTHRAGLLRLLRLLGLGLILVDSGQCPPAATVLLDPKAYAPRPSPKLRGKLLAEFDALVGDPNTGGIDRRRGRMTPYRQRALRIAHALAAEGPARPRDLRDRLGIPDAWNILYHNPYHWFERTAPGRYGLSERGRREVPQWTLPADAAAYP